VLGVPGQTALNRPPGGLEVASADLGFRQASDAHGCLTAGFEATREPLHSIGRFAEAE